MLQLESQRDSFANSGWRNEIAGEADNREAQSVLGNIVGIIESQTLVEPVLDQAIEHDEILREKNNARRIAIGEPDQPFAKKSIVDNFGRHGDLGTSRLFSCAIAHFLMREIGLDLVQ